MEDQKQGQDAFKGALSLSEIKQKKKKKSLFLCICLPLILEEEEGRGGKEGGGRGEEKKEEEEDTEQRNTRLDPTVSLSHVCQVIYTRISQLHSNALVKHQGKKPISNKIDDLWHSHTKEYPMIVKMSRLCNMNIM